MERFSLFPAAPVKVSGWVKLIAFTLTSQMQPWLRSPPQEKKTNDFGLLRVILSPPKSRRTAPAA